MVILVEYQKLEIRQGIDARKSVRSFQSTDIPDSLLEELITLAKKGSSAGAIRGYEAIITRDFDIYGAPVYVVICIDVVPYAKRYGTRGMDLYAIQDAAIFGAYLQLLLVDAGLSSVWIGAFREVKVQKILKTTLRPVAIIALGYKKDE